jgi:hypothetical protein
MKKREPESPTPESIDAPPAPEERGAVVALASIPPEAPEAPAPRDADTLGAGVEAARRIEESAERARRARSHAKRARNGDARRATRRALKKLLAALQARQEAVLSQGILPEDHHALVAHLHAMDRAFEEFLARRPRKGSLKPLRKAAKTLRRSL